MSYFRITTSIFALLITVFSFTTHADFSKLQFEIDEAIRNNSDFVKNSYIIGFRNPSAFNKERNGNKPLIDPPNVSKRGETPFGEHSSGQNKENLASELGLRGEVISILDAINAVHVKMDAQEAERWRKDKRVEYVEQDKILTANATQSNPGWGLDRIDESSAMLDNTYNYSNTGAGQTIYVLDTGLDLSKPAVAAEFGGRASIIWDVNGGNGFDCHDHGSRVASVAAGNTVGVAKAATLIIAKITSNCTRNATASAVSTAFNWLATNAPAGTIANFSFGLSSGSSCTPKTDVAIENAIKSAHNAGVIVVVAAGNDGCNTADFTPARIQEAFVVGATTKDRINSFSQDAKRVSSRTGSNISAFAPGESVSVINQSGNMRTASGTSYAAPYISGIFAVACQAAAPLCANATTAASLYTALKNTGTLGTVTDPDGTPLTGATSRFIRQQW